MLIRTKSNVRQKQIRDFSFLFIFKIFPRPDIPFDAIIPKLVQKKNKVAKKIFYFPNMYCTDSGSL